MTATPRAQRAVGSEAASGSASEAESEPAAVDPQADPARTEPGAGDFSGLETSLIATIGPVFRHLMAHARRRPTWKSLTYQQYNVMRIADTNGPTAQADIARRLLVSAPVVTRLASALVDGDLIERRGDPNDRRSVLLALTPKGRRRVRAMRHDLLKAAHELIEPLAEERRASVSSALDELTVLLPSRSQSSKTER